MDSRAIAVLLLFYVASAYSSRGPMYRQEVACHNSVCTTATRKVDDPAELQASWSRFLAGASFLLGVALIGVTILVIALLFSVFMCGLAEDYPRAFGTIVIALSVVYVKYIY